MAPSTDTMVNGSRRGRRWAFVTAAGVVLLAIAAGLLIRHQQSDDAGHGSGAAPASLQSSVGAEIAHVLVIDCAGGTAATEPTELNLTCGDGSIIFNRIVWSSWSDAAAIGTGMLGENNCIPNCAAGTIVTEPATVALAAPGPSAGSTIYTSMTITPVPPNGAGFRPISAKVPQ
ncbi:hypothetical protein SAMN05892883_0172 [Jatrophihabitans sp. GAS493]|uniref:hypothetical protein n=1 Tax=Jatrophihabitans sp. GAS493 TaxID=1907575 RepID=UPI000BB71EB2|nr:hypothetical protein [Jatrophihabitans sp. GAS493]SOD70476.1 hypothetical protein SAMN05892883_0172 [Jatrophihabitans sp. GAS493]